MNSKPSRYALLLLVSASLSPAAARAQAVVFNFSAVVDNVFDSATFLPDDLVNGLVVHGTVTYQLGTVTDTFPGDPNNGVYRFEGAAKNDFSVTATIGSHVFTSIAEPPLANYVQAYLSESYHLLDHGAREPLMDGSPMPATFNGVSMNVQFWDNTATALANDSLPSQPPVFGAFVERDFYINGSGIGGASSDYYIHAPITDLHAVPEPAWTATLGAALATGFGLWRRLRRPTGGS